MGLGQYEPVMDHLNVSETAKMAEFPWLVSIEVNQKKICTGSLINENVVMTSAGCVIARNAETVKVRAGSWKSSAKVGLQTEELRNVARIISLDETVNRFRPSIALIILEKPIEINMFVAATCLTDLIENLEMNDCLAVGWKSGKSALDDLMVESKIELLSCAELMADVNVMLPGRSKCANMKQNLEIGSVLMCRVNGTEMTYQQVGIVDQAMSGSSVAFLTDVTQFKKQIDEKFTELALDNDSYTFSFLRSRSFRNWWSRTTSNVNTFFSNCFHDDVYRNKVIKTSAMFVTVAAPFVALFG